MPSSASPRYVRLTPSLHDALPIFAPQNIQASGELIDARDRFSDSTEGILPESGIIKMHREILQHQAKRRRRILKIVDKECGNSLKRLQFLAAHNLPRKSKVQQTRCDLVPDAFQQIQFLDRVR